MKLVLAIFFISASHFSNAQANLLKAREIYDFAVGDTFEYHFGESQGFQRYYYDIITQRFDNGNDSIVYTQNEISSNSQPSIGRVVIRNLDSTFQYIFGSGCNSNCAITNSFCLVGPDSTCEMEKEIYSNWPCEFGSTAVTTTTTVRCQKYLGTTWQESSSTICGFLSAHITNLIYAHKANGYIYGTQQGFVTAINNLSEPLRISVYPNPANSYFYVQYKQATEISAQLKIFDLFGRLVKQIPVLKELNQVDRNSLSNGLYLWTAEDENNILQRGKIVLE
jgi:hypothetical protein